MRLTKFIDKHKIIHSNQHGFQKGVGTNDALSRVPDYIFAKLDKSEPTMTTFLDLAKAFDTAHHELLLNKLYNYGIRGPRNQRPPCY